MKKNDLLQYISNQAQAGGTRHYVLSDGWGSNMSSGLKYTILPDRGLDISLASFKAYKEKARGEKREKVMELKKDYLKQINC